MSKGFAVNESSTVVQVIVKRLTPAAKREDEHAFVNGFMKMIDRYGWANADEALRQLIVSHDWIMNCIMKHLPEDKQRIFEDEAVDMIAELLSDAGLRLEDHIRVGDQGIALTKEGVKVIRGTGYPRASDFGVGNDSLDEMGIDRNPFMHHLAEFDKENEYMNLWAASSFFISAALGWLNPPSDNPEKPRGIIKEVVSFSSPTADVEKMLHRARYNDRMLLRLTSLIEEGLRIKFNQAFEKQ